MQHWNCWNSFLLNLKMKGCDSQPFLLYTFKIEKLIKSLIFSNLNEIYPVC